MSSEKNILPTKKKLEKAHKDGDLLKSRDLTVCIQLLVVPPVLLLSARLFYGSFQSLLLLSAESLRTKAYEALAGKIFLALSLLLLPVLAHLCSGLVVESIQSRGYCSAKAFSLKLNRLNPLEGLAKIWRAGAQNSLFPWGPLGESLKFSFFAGASCAAFYYALGGSIESIFYYDGTDIEELIRAYYEVGTHLVYGLMLLSAMLAILDFRLQSRRRRKRLMMDSAELKQELKESEGNPETRGMRRQLHQELIFSGFLTSLRKAKMILTGGS